MVDSMASKLVAPLVNNLVLTKAVYWDAKTAQKLVANSADY
jgi:hypothetical protein